MRIRSGMLNSRGVLQMPQETDDGMGGKNIAFVDVSTVWMQWSPGSGKESWMAQHQQPTASHSVYIRYRNDIRPNWRVKVAGRVFRVLSVLDEENTKEILSLACEEFVQ